MLDIAIVAVAIIGVLIAGGIGLALLILLCFDASEDEGSM